MITTKTLKYSHAKTCGIVKPPVETPTIKQLPDADIPNVIKPVVSAIKQRNTVHKADVSVKPRSLSPTKPTTLEEMRHNYYINAKLQRAQKINKLFANAV